VRCVSVLKAQCCCCCRRRRRCCCCCCCCRRRRRDLMRRAAQDPVYVQGLREAKALLDEGVLSQEEFNTEKSELVKQREERKAASEAGVPLRPGPPLPPGVQPPPPPPPPGAPGQPAGLTGAAGALSLTLTRTGKRTREDAYTVPPGLRHALKPLSKMPGRETMGDSRVRCALCTQKGSVYCLECTKAKGTGIYALCCPSSGRICACLHWSDMVTGHVATWLPYGRPPPEADGAGARRTPAPGGKSKGTGRPRGRPVGWRKNKGVTGAEAGAAGTSSAGGGGGGGGGSGGGGGGGGSGGGGGGGGGGGDSGPESGAAVLVHSPASHAPPLLCRACLIVSWCPAACAPGDRASGAAGGGARGGWHRRQGCDMWACVVAGGVVQLHGERHHWHRCSGCCGRKRLRSFRSGCSSRSCSPAGACPRSSSSC